MKNLLIILLLIITVIEGGFIFYLCKKPSYIVKIVYEEKDELMNLPTVPKETIKGLD